MQTIKEKVLQGLKIPGLEPVQVPGAYCPTCGCKLQPTKVYRVVDECLILNDANGYGVFSVGPTYSVGGRLYIIFSAEGDRI